MNPVVAAATAIAILVSGNAWAATATTAGHSNGAPGFLLAFAIAYLARRRQIGGWLLYFYMQLYISFLLDLILWVPAITELSPGKWDSSRLYVLYFVSMVPVILVMVMLVVTATTFL